MSRAASPRILLFTCERWPTAAMLADALIASGLDVGALRPSGHPLIALAAARFQRAYHHRTRHAVLAQAIDAFAPGMVIPCACRTASSV